MKEELIVKKIHLYPKQKKMAFTLTTGDVHIFPWANYPKMPDYKSVILVEAENATFIFRDLYFTVENFFQKEGRSYFNNRFFEANEEISSKEIEKHNEKHFQSSYASKLLFAKTHPNLVPFFEQNLEELEQINQLRLLYKISC